MSSYTGILLRFALALAFLLPVHASDMDAMMEVHFPAPSKKGDKKKKEGKAFAEVIEEATRIEGLFTLYHDEKKNQVWLSVLPEQLDKDFLLSMTQETGIGARGMLSGLPAGHSVVQFRKVGEHIHLLKKNLMFRPTGGYVGTELMVERNFSDSPVGAFKIVAEPHEDSGALLVKAGDVFLDDLIGVGRRLKRVLKTPYQQQKDMSWLDRLQSFPKNTEIGTRYAFATKEPKNGWSTLEDPRFVEIRVRYSLSELPESDYEPRLADPRVGYFQTGWRTFGDDTVNDPMIRVANRWHLKKQDPAAALSEPVEPITFWLENAIPLELRPIVSEGVLAWNKAFEAAGFRNAVVVKQQPDDADWDPADIRYNVIRWISSSELSFGAMGPSQVNPYTGQILNADILIEADMVRRIGWGWRAGVSPLGAALPDPREEDDGGALAELLQPSGTQERFPGSMSHACCANALLKREASDLVALNLLAKGVVQPNGEMPWEYTRQYLFALVAHEVGHTLGLRHNFRGSLLHSFEDLTDTEKTSIGVVSSVMEYDPPNIARDPEKQGHFYNPTVGPYDIWAIQWGYTPAGGGLEEDRAAIRPIADRSTEPQLIYGTDEDAYNVRGWGSAVDPECRVFDLSSDKVTWTKEQLLLARELMRADPARFLAPDEDHLVYRSAFQRAFRGYWQNIDALSRYVGGIRTRREPAYVGLKPLAPYSGEEQRGALQAIVEATCEQETWQIAGEQLDHMGQGYRWSFDGSTDVKRIDFPLYSYLAGNRSQVIRNLYAPRRLARVSEHSARGEQGALQLEEVFTAFDKAIWSGAPATLPMRDLQAIHAGQLIELLTAKKDKADRDVRLLAAEQLRSYKAKIDRWQSQKIRRSAVDRAHLADLQRRIDAALAMERDKL